MFLEAKELRKAQILDLQAQYVVMIVQIIRFGRKRFLELRCEGYYLGL